MFSNKCPKKRDAQIVHVVPSLYQSLKENSDLLSSVNLVGKNVNRGMKKEKKIQSMLNVRMKFNENANIIKIIGIAKKKVMILKTNTIWNNNVHGEIQKNVRIALHIGRKQTL